MLILEATLAVAIGSWIHVPGGTWQPTPADIQMVQTQIHSYVERGARARPYTRLLPWSSYSFQYQGDGFFHKSIYINAFCEAPPSYAAKEFVEVMDGGPCFFHLQWDPATRTFSSLSFNGEA
jgi:hypothetical protein